jgi:hypothetical protein
MVCKNGYKPKHMGQSQCRFQQALLPVSDEWKRGKPGVPGFGAVNAGGDYAVNLKPGNGTYRTQGTYRTNNDLSMSERISVHVAASKKFLNKSDRRVRQMFESGIFKSARKTGLGSHARWDMLRSELLAYLSNSTIPQ